MAQLAFLGTGLLGAGFAQAAAQRGDSVAAWNRTAAKAQELTQYGVRAAASPAQAVQGASRVHLILKDDAVVNEVIAAARPALAANAIVIDHTTTLPELTAQRAQRLAAEGVRYLHCPVFMGPAAARAAKGSMLACGPLEWFDAVRTDLAAMTAQLEYLGERTDVAAVHKLMGNALILALSGTIADVLTIAQAGRIPAEDALKVFGLLDVNSMLAFRTKTLAQGQFPLSFELQMARKDVRLMQEAAGQRPLAVLNGLAARMDELIAAGLGGADTSVLAQHAVT